MIPVKKFNYLLNSRQKRKVLTLLFFIIIGMFLETLGVGLIIPIFTIITDPNIAEKYPMLYYSDIERIVNTVFETITKSINSEDRVELRGFATFEKGNIP